jgi:molecular chaperone DnaK (HSP70)
MKTTAKEKAKAIADYLRIATRKVTPDEIEAAVLKALKEQDRDTRHACAEAVISIPPEIFDTDKDDCLISADKAHAACMNTKAI